MQSKLILVFSLLAMSSISQAYAQVGSRFEVIYVDRKSGLEWGSVLPGTYTNGCFDESGNQDKTKCTYDELNDGWSYRFNHVRVEDSDAAKACRAIGARLPTVVDYEHLVTEFNFTSHRPIPGITHALRLTSQGKDEMAKIFGHRDTLFWTSSVDPTYSRTRAYGFKISVGMSYGVHRFNFMRPVEDGSRLGHAVRCVR